MSKGKRKKARSKRVEKRVEVKEVPVKSEAEESAKLEITEFVLSIVGVVLSLGVPGTLVKRMGERVIATTWVYPVLNAVFGCVIVFLISKYQKLNPAFVSRKVRKLTGREATKTEHPVQKIMYVVIFLAAWWIYFVVVACQYALVVNVRYNVMLYKVLQCLNIVASVIAGAYRLIAVELRKPPYKEVYQLRFWVVQIGATIVWGVTGILILYWVKLGFVE